MQNLYPLKFKTIFKDKIWGGQKIRTVLGKDFGDLPNCGETWEISGVEGNVSIVDNGPLEGVALTRLLKDYGSDLLGESVYNRFGDEFPLLVKFIDANDDLSIQVHPDDKLAKERHNSFGKTEMWYVFQADEGSSLITGFNQDLTKETYQEYFSKGELLNVLNKEYVKEDDVYFLPAGRVHTIGKGLLLAEIQQTSDVTYRIYDFDRKDDQGNTRELHVEKALDAIDYKCYPEYKTRYEDKENEPVELVKCQYFETNKICATESMIRDYSDLDSFVIYVCFEGQVILKTDDFQLNVSKGDAVLIPACVKRVQLLPTPNCELLESWVPNE